MAGSPEPPPPSTAPARGARDEPYGSIIDRFRGTEWEVTPPPPPPQRTGLSGGFVTALGVVVLVAAGILGILVLPPGGSGPTPPASRVILTPPPTPGPGDLVLAAFWAQIQASDLDYHVAIEGSLEVGSASGSQVVVLDVHGDDFQGTLAEHFKGSATSHWVLLRSEGVLYARKSSQTRWSVAGPATGLGLSVRPFLSLEDERQLTYGGTVTRDGTILHRLRSTALYRPGINRILPIFIASIASATTTLELLVTADGIPVEATITCHAPRDLQTGEPAVDGSASYTFSKVGQIGPIPTPKL